MQSPLGAGTAGFSGPARPSIPPDGPASRAPAAAGRPSPVRSPHIHERAARLHAECEARLGAFLRLLEAGLLSVEAAARVGVNRATAVRYVAELRRRGHPVNDLLRVSGARHRAEVLRLRHEGRVAEVALSFRPGESISSVARRLGCCRKLAAEAFRLTHPAPEPALPVMAVPSAEVLARVAASRSESKPRPANPIRERACLCCGRPFRSEGAHHRMCDVCRRNA